MRDSQHYPPAFRSWLVWGLGAALYFIAFYQRVTPAVMAEELMADFAITATALGNFSAFYFYSYVAMQIPTGILADSLGPRKLLITGTFVAGVGTLIFGFAPHIMLANAGRLLIGASVAVAWVVLLKLSTRWFPPSRYAFVSGIALAVGVIGAVSAGVPLRILIEHFTWRPVMVVSGIITLLLTGAIWFVVKDDPADCGYKSYDPTTERHMTLHPGAVFSRLAKILRYRNTWLLTIAPGGIVGPVQAFAGLWGVPYFCTHYGLTPARAAFITSILLVSWAVGGPFWGGLSDRIGRRKPIYVICSIVAATGWAVLLFVPELPFSIVIMLVVIVGFASGTVIIGFAYVKESLSPSLAGTVSGFCNMGYMIGPMLLQPVMGFLLDLMWDGTVHDGVRLYSLAAYRGAFVVMIAFSTMAIILLLFTQETYCRQTLERE